MRMFVVVLIAYLITGVHYVWRDLNASIVRRPAYARHPTVMGAAMAVLIWLPFSLTAPFMVGWYWRSLREYIFSLTIFILLVTIGIALTK